MSKYRKGKFDVKLLICILVMVVFGAFVIFSASFYNSLVKTGNMYVFLKKDIQFAVMGLISMAVMMRIPYYRLKGPIGYTMFGAGLVLLVLVLFIGTEINGARRWLDIGFTSFMPSELVKYAGILLFASMLSMEDNLGSFKEGVLKYLVVIGVVGVLIMKQPNMSTTLLISVTMASMLFAAGMRRRHMVLCALPAVPLAAALMILEPYRFNRLLSVMDPFKYADKEGYQVVNSLYAFAKGGLFGVGLGKGSMNKLFLPESETDFIFATIGEEFGFIGTVAVVLLFVYIIYRGYRIALSCEDRFGFYLAFGITTSIALQFLINIAVTISLVPPTGIPLPFISYGGSHLVMLLTGMGVLLNISSYANKGEYS